MDTENIKALRICLETTPIGVESKLHNYTVLQDILKKIQAGSEVIQDEELQVGILKKFCSDITSENALMQYAALEMLNLLYKCKRENFFPKNIPNDCLRLAYDDDPLSSCRTREVALNCVTSIVQDFIIKDNCNPELFLLNAKTEGVRKAVTYFILFLFSLSYSFLL